MAKSRFVIVLSDEERVELERRVACYTRPHKEVQRAKMVLYAAEGRSNAEIARRLETAAEVVGRWRKRFFEQRLVGLDDDPGGRARIQQSLPPSRRSRGQRVEHTYQRKGALTYLAALDIGRRGSRRPRVFARSERRDGIEPFDRLIRQVMTREPYASARRVFWIVDNGSSHRGQKTVDRLQHRWPNLILVHLPVHASWLNQIEIYAQAARAE